MPYCPESRQYALGDERLEHAIDVLPAHLDRVADELHGSLDRPHMDETIGPAGGES